ncbi:hypothetical protein PVK06_045126 [Gossypium arboreum]|uniref:DUF4283 domain-containing protein n=1 Tax=Gossypium arboreum TaxID=29729 RepID=A0ABR0MT73_GOSAR|nr:hypothetical protein PVK06_045126 [Gossypium arboreum]
MKAFYNNGDEIIRISFRRKKKCRSRGQGNVDVIEEDYELCLMGRVLTDSVVHFSLTKITLVDLWHPLGGVAISEIGEKRHLFFAYDNIFFGEANEEGAYTRQRLFM